MSGPQLNPILLEAHNPSPMTGLGNNTYLLARGGSALLIDAGVGHPEHVAAVERTLAEADARLDRVLVTHGHADHASGALLLADRHAHAEFAKYPWPAEDQRYGVAWRYLSNGESIAIGDDRLCCLHTPGHSPDHLVFWHEPTRTVFTGDLVVVGSSVMIQSSRGGSLLEYLASLERVLALEPGRLLPAHGPEPADPAALLVGYLEHRRMRERQVVTALESGRSTVQAIAESIYDGLDPSLMPAARENVRAHLEKLRVEGRAAADADRWRICGQGH